MGIHIQDKTRQDWSHIASHPTQTSRQFAVVRGPPRGGEWAQAPNCLKSLVICDSRFESQIAIAVKSRDLEHLDYNPFPFSFPCQGWAGISKKGAEKRSTLQSEILAKLIPKTLFTVNEMRFIRKIIPKTFFYVIL